MRFLILILSFCLMFCSNITNVMASTAKSRPNNEVQGYLDKASNEFKNGNYDKALNELRRAEALTELALIRFNIARCLEELGRANEAVAAYENYLALNDTSEGANELQKRAKEAVARLEAQVEAMKASARSVENQPVKAPSSEAEAITKTANVEQPPQSQPVPEGKVSVHFISSRKGDNFYIKIDSENEIRREAPCEMWLAPGKHRIYVSGAASYEQEIDIPDGKEIIVKIERRRNGWIVIGVAGLLGGAALTTAGYIQANSSDVTEEQKSNGYAAAGLGICVAVTGTILGLILSKHNRLVMESSSKGNSKEKAGLFSPSLLSIGMAPTKNNGMMLGAAFSF